MTDGVLTDEATIVLNINGEQHTVSDATRVYTLAGIPATVTTSSTTDRPLWGRCTCLAGVWFFKPDDEVVAIVDGQPLMDALLRMEGPDHVVALQRGTDRLEFRTQYKGAPNNPGPAYSRYSSSDWLSVGRRGSGCDLEIDSPTVLLEHVRYRRVDGGGVKLQGVGEATLVVKGQEQNTATLQPGESALVGGHLVRVSPAGQLEADGAMGLTTMQLPIVDTAEQTAVTEAIPRSTPLLKARDWSARYKTSKTACFSEMDFDIPGGSVVAVIGPSGVGKSSICKALIGDLGATQGLFQFDGHAFPAGLPAEVLAFVPQADHLLPGLTVRQTLSYAADARLARDLTRAEKNRRVDEMLAGLELTEHADRFVKELSGGTQKRLSVGIELLAEPRVLVLDEPTSGLDDGLDRALMKLFSRMVNPHTTVIVVTHATANLEEADYVLALGKGGRRGFFGPPEELLPHFEASSHGDVMDALRDETKYAPAASVGPDGGHTPNTWRGGHHHPRSSAAQLKAVVGREVRRLAPFSAARPLLARLNLWRLFLYVVAAPAVTVGMSLLVSTEGLDPAANPRAGMVLSLLVTATVLFSMSMTSGELVRDFDFARRELRWGVPTWVVIVGKLIPYSTIAAIQGLVVAWLFCTFSTPAEDVSFISGPVGLGITLALLAASSTALTLLCSSGCGTIEAAMYVMMLVALLQVAMNGVFVPLGSAETLAEATFRYGSLPVPSRWSVASLGAMMDLNTTLVPDNEDSFFDQSVIRVVAPWFALIAIGVGSVFAAIAVYKSRLSKRV